MKNTEAAMTCGECGRTMNRNGSHRDGRQRWRCRPCKVTALEPAQKLFGDMRIDEEKALMALTLLCEGSAVRAVCRVTGFHKGTVLKLLKLAGKRAEQVMAEQIKDVPVKDVECDETWSYVGCKERTKRKNGVDDPQQGDAYAWIALERNSKLVLCWHLGRRTNLAADAFAEKLDRATSGEFQVSTDGFESYVDSLGYHVGGRSSYGQIIKDYGYDEEGQRRYAPPKLISSEKSVIYGAPDQERICTSHVERWNLSLRLGMKRVSRLTVAFSRCWKNHKAALALWIAYYNFCRRNRSVRMTPAMAAGVTRSQWTMRDLMKASAA